jgi:hypothetical protein
MDSSPFSPSDLITQQFTHQGEKSVGRVSSGHFSNRMCEKIGVRADDT